MTSFAIWQVAGTDSVVIVIDGNEYPFAFDDIRAFHYRLSKVVRKTSMWQWMHRHGIDKLSPAQRRAYKKEQRILRREPDPTPILTSEERHAINAAMAAQEHIQ